MKDIYKNPIFYYILVPAILTLWPLLVRAVYLPAAQQTLKDEQAQYKKAEQIMTEILTLDPARLEDADSKTDAEEFDYARAIEQVATSCAISPEHYKLNSGIIIKSGDKKSQNANVTLKDVDITKSAKFLSKIQLHWANLQCVRLKLTKKKTLPDLWDVNLEFKYYY